MLRKQITEVKKANIKIVKEYQKIVQLTKMRVYNKNN